MMLDGTRLMTTRDLAALLGQSEDAVRRKAQTGEIPALRVGLGARAPFRFDPLEVRAWLYGPELKRSRGLLPGGGGAREAGPPFPGVCTSAAAPLGQQGER
jgi:excisionase family DNA binding protein